MIGVRVAVGALAGIAALLLYARLPDRDRRRAYPDRPQAWLGMTGEPAVVIGHVFVSAFFWMTALAVYGFISAGASLLMQEPAVSAVAGTVALAVAWFIARSLLRLGPGALRVPRRPVRTPTEKDRPRVLFIGGSPNQTTQMHQIADQLPEVDAWFTPYYTDNLWFRMALRWGFLEVAIIGYRRRGICLDYLNTHGLQVDLQGERHRYDLVVTCNDQVMPLNLRHAKQVLVQEGIQDPPNWKYHVWKWTRLLPRPVIGTSNFGLSDLFDKFCVASDGYRRHFERLGVKPEKIEVTGIPNFDNFAKFRQNDFPHRDYVLVCTTDARERGADSQRNAVLKEVVAFARDRQLIFKLHPNENFERATQEIHAVAPKALVYTSGSAEEMVANCAVLFTEWSSLTLCGLALDKEVHSHHPIEKVKDLLPLQHNRGAANIADVCRTLLGDRWPTALAHDETTSPASAPSASTENRLHA